MTSALVDSLIGLIEKSMQAGTDGHSLNQTLSRDFPKLNVSLQLLVWNVSLGEVSGYQSFRKLFEIQILFLCSYSVVHKTEVIKKTLNPKWQRFSVSSQILCNGDSQRYILYFFMAPESANNCFLQYDILLLFIFILDKRRQNVMYLMR